jgi:hypothetical protein
VGESAPDLMISAQSESFSIKWRSSFQDKYSVGSCSMQIQTVFELPDVLNRDRAIQRASNSLLEDFLAIVSSMTRISA